ncbi:YceD family protein, partial [Agrococcus terreus]
MSNQEVRLMSEISIQSGVTLPDKTKPWVLSISNLIDSPGSSEHTEVTWPAPAELSVPLLGIEQDSAMQVDIRLDSVHEGVLVSGTVEGTLTGQCSRCLDPIS